jgi:hypothetical protein
MTMSRRFVALLVACPASWLGAANGAPAAQAEIRAVSISSLPIVELRQYTLVPGKRDVLIELFEREFIEGQEQTGMVILGQFRDLDRPDLFVWLRGFTDMPLRARSLAAFYDGPIWKAHRATANATMIDSTNVLMMQPARAESGFLVDLRDRAPRGATAAPPSLVTAVIYSFAKPVDAGFVEYFERSVRPVVESKGGRVLATFITNLSPNNFPRLPQREGEQVFVWFAQFANEAAHNAFLAADEWRQVSTDVDRRLTGKPEIHRLRPTARSLVGR